MNTIALVEIWTRLSNYLLFFFLRYQQNILLHILDILNVIVCTSKHWINFCLFPSLKRRTMNRWLSLILPVKKRVDKRLLHRGPGHWLFRFRNCVTFNNTCHDYYYHNYNSISFRPTTVIHHPVEVQLFFFFTFNCISEMFKHDCQERL